MSGESGQAAAGYQNRTLLPGSTIGMLGGGQLGRMMALAGTAMGYDSSRLIQLWIRLADKSLDQVVGCL